MQHCSLGQGAVSPWSIVPRCLRVLQVLLTTSYSSLVYQLSQSHYPPLLEKFATPRDSEEQCSMGTLPLVPRSNVASSGPTLTITSNHYHRKTQGSHTSCHRIFGLQTPFLHLHNHEICIIWRGTIQKLFFSFLLLHMITVLNNSYFQWNENILWYLFTLQAS